MASLTCTDRFKYDVFLSFRGQDTRHGFTGNLWKALSDSGIHTFTDDEELQKGEEITPSLIKSIEDSNMAIVVLSKNYASSSFCLQELSTILDSIKDKGRCVWPVFYDVDPSDVRNLKRSYEEAMAQHEKRSNNNMVLLQKWKNALNQVANLSGFDFKNGDEYEHVFIEKIVEQVSSEIIPVTLSVPDYLVGLEYPMQIVTSLLNDGPDDKGHMVGIYGIGGIGKTTLAVAVYNSIADGFKGLCFLENIRENSEKHGLPYLQNILLYETVGEKKIKLTNVKNGMTVIQQRLGKKKVLLLLDDVNKEEQLHAIAGSPDWFGPGSRVIITTRDKQLLTSHGVQSTYEVKELNRKDAFELLRQKAFKSEKVSFGYENILNYAVTYASSLPLALEVIGSHFFNKTIEECKDALDRYEKVPHKKLALDSLETLDLSDCTSLESFSPVVNNVFGDKLKTMSVRGCINLRSIPLLKLDSLETLDLSFCFSLESFPLVVDRFLGKLKTLLAKNCHNLKSIPPLKLDSLEKLDLSNCYRLESFSSVVDGLLDKLKFVNIEYCIMLRSIPRLRLTSLEHFNLSCCYSLESLPEILGEMRNIHKLLLDKTSINEFLFPEQNLTQPQTLHPCNCESTVKPKLIIQSEENVNPMQSSDVKYVCVGNCKLPDEYLSKNLMLFANVKELHLTNNLFTFIPKSIEKCHFLWKLVLDDCKKLQDIEAIPRCLRVLSALDCMSLTSLCKNKLLNQELHEAGNTWFRLPRVPKIPEWFDLKCEAGWSISFWFRNKFPAISICVVSPLTLYFRHCRVRVIINENTFFYTHGSEIRWRSQPNTYHLHLFHMQMENFNDNMDKVLSENKWNHAEVYFGFPFMNCGIHVLKEKSNMKDIQFTNPENDTNIVLHSGC